MLALELAEVCLLLAVTLVVGTLAMAFIKSSESKGSCCDDDHKDQDVK